MSEFLEQYTVAVEGRMSDSRSGALPSLTVWVIPIAATSMDERRALIRTVFSQTEGEPNAIAFYNPDGSATLDTSDTGEIPKDLNINATLNLAWTGDETSPFMDGVGELMALAVQMMQTARVTSLATGHDEQELLDKLFASTGLTMKRCRQQRDGTYILEA